MPAVDAVHVVLTCINKFINGVQLLIRGKYPDNGFRIKWDQAKKSFHDSIVKQLRPRFIISATSDVTDANRRINVTKSRSGICEIYDLTEEDNDEMGTPHPIQAQVTPKKRKVEDNDTPGTPSRRPARTVDPGKGTAFRNQTVLMSVEAATKYSVEYIRSWLDRYTPAGLQGNFDPEAMDDLILECFNKWDKPASDLLIATKQALLAALTETTHRCLLGYEKTELFSVLERTVQHFVTNKFEQYEQSMSMFLKYEKHKPSTMDRQAETTVKVAALQDLKEHRFRARTEKVLEARAEATSKPPAEIEQALKNPRDRQDMERCLGIDPFQREIEVMSGIRAYYTVASSRYTDNVYRAMEVDVFEELRKVKDTLSKEVLFCEENVYDRSIQLLAEDPERERRRTMLKQEKARLEEARQMLDALVEKHQPNGLDDLTSNEHVR